MKTTLSLSSALEKSPHLPPTDGAISLKDQADQFADPTAGNLSRKIRKDIASKQPHPFRFAADVDPTLLELDEGIRCGLVPVDDIYVNPGKSQRRLASAHVKKIVGNFKPAYFGSITLARLNGIYYCVDGQQRGTGAIIGGATHLPAIIYDVSSIDDVADVFSAMNTRRKGVPPEAKFLCSVELDNPTDVALNDVIVRSGFIVDECPQGAVPTITSITSIKKLVASTDAFKSKLHNFSTTSRVLALALDLWCDSYEEQNELKPGEEPMGTVLRAMGLLVHYCVGDRGQPLSHQFWMDFFEKVSTNTDGVQTQQTFRQIAKSAGGSMSGEKAPVQLALALVEYLKEMEMSDANKKAYDNGKWALDATWNQFLKTK